MQHSENHVTERLLDSMDKLRKEWDQGDDEAKKLYLQSLHVFGPALIDAARQSIDMQRTLMAISQTSLLRGQLGNPYHTPDVLQAKLNSCHAMAKQYTPTYSSKEDECNAAESTG